MRLDVLLRAIEPMEVWGPLNRDITGLAYDSRQVRPGYLFAALPGERQDGHQYIRDAAERGAAAFLTQKEEPNGPDVAGVLVKDAREALARIACAYYGHPSAKLEVVGVTGTNGKTTVTRLTRDILSAADRSPGAIGTLSYEVGARVIPASRTTPESVDIQSLLSQMVAVGCRSVVMEVSSHALSQARVLGTQFDVAVFTNLTRDHLDYHETMEAYFDAKSRLFQPPLFGPETGAVINVDDPWGRKLAAAGQPAAPGRLVLYGCEAGAHVRAEEIVLSPRGSSFLARTPWGERRMTLRLLGRYNVYNALAALAAGGALGVDLDRMVHVLSSVTFVPGRLEEIPTGKGFQVFVDYAHTDDALGNVLRTLRELTRSRLIVVFGCGGNRDRGKRPAMGAVASQLADHVVITSDNPRREEPGAIIAEIRAGIRAGCACEVQEDRRQAIAAALHLAAPGDIVLVAGKGHENYQEFGNRVVPFDDRQVVREIIG